jgi:hypothetical protein
LTQTHVHILLSPFKIRLAAIAFLSTIIAFTFKNWAINNDELALLKTVIARDLGTRKYTGIGLGIKGEEI